VKVKNASEEEDRLGWHYDYKDLQQLKAAVEKINEDGCSLEQLQDVLDITGYKEQQSQLRLLANGILEAHTSYAEFEERFGDFAGDCQCHRCVLAREIMEVGNE